MPPSTALSARSRRGGLESAKKVYKLFPEMERMDVIMQRVRDAENADGEYED